MQGDVMEYYSIGRFSKLIGKNAQTLREWDKKDELKPHHITPSGYRYYSQEQLNHFLGLKGVVTNTKKVIEYCRVSSKRMI